MICANWPLKVRFNLSFAMLVIWLLPFFFVRGFLLRQLAYLSWCWNCWAFKVLLITMSIWSNEKWITTLVLKIELYIINSAFKKMQFFFFSLIIVQVLLFAFDVYKWEKGFFFHTTCKERTNNYLICRLQTYIRVIFLMAVSDPPFRYQLHSVGSWLTFVSWLSRFNDSQELFSYHERC